MVPFPPSLWRVFFLSLVMNTFTAHATAIQEQKEFRDVLKRLRHQSELEDPRVISVKFIDLLPDEHISYFTTTYTGLNRQVDFIYCNKTVSERDCNEESLHAGRSGVHLVKENHIVMDEGFQILKLEHGVEGSAKWQRFVWEKTGPPQAAETLPPIQHSALAISTGEVASKLKPAAAIKKVVGTRARRVLGRLWGKK